ncbi:DUF4349 domain-containing protein [Nocardioides sp. W3-2-3]|uniref:DUF4349 domain-containing protein n=1 Tax=Nocardioides convexus TaxID=2712224 RepID=UPI0024184EBF|nr:DUF4349 domain-containing protein [Nocardioides convexus]NHA00469.1 DUF4349 domain-containing protein [Nocardioides convexus]
MHPTRTRLALSLAGAAALVALTGCSSGSSGSSTPARTSADSAGSAEPEGGVVGARRAGRRRRGRRAHGAGGPRIGAGRRDHRHRHRRAGGGGRDEGATRRPQGRGPAAGPADLAGDQHRRRGRGRRGPARRPGAERPLPGDQGRAGGGRHADRLQAPRRRTSRRRSSTSPPGCGRSGPAWSGSRRCSTGRRTSPRWSRSSVRLADRQANLDALVARQRDLADKTSLSTITVSIEQADRDGTTKDDDTAGGFLGGLRDGWDAFTGGVVVTLTVLGFALPWLILVAALGVPLWWALRRRAARRPAAPGPVTPATP